MTDLIKTEDGHDRDARIEETVRFTARAFGQLLIARRDVKAIEYKGGWVPDRERVPRGTDPREGALIPFKMGDFRQHLLEKRCLGTYLLDETSHVKFIAFDLDLSPKESIYYKVHDPEDFELDPPTLDLKVRRGPLEPAMHVSGEPAYRWARTIIWSQVVALTEIVKEQLGLPVLPVITGGGAHVIVPFGTLTPAAEARVMANSIMEATGWELYKGNAFWRSPTNPESGLEIEVFPKQDKLTDSQGFGNLIRLPLGWHSGAGVRTYFLDLYSPPSVPAWVLPKRSSMSVLKDALNFFGLE